MTRENICTILANLKTVENKMDEADNLQQTIMDYRNGMMLEFFANIEVQGKRTIRVPLPYSRTKDLVGILEDQLREIKAEIEDIQPGDMCFTEKKEESNG